MHSNTRFTSRPRHLASATSNSFRHKRICVLMAVAMVVAVCIIINLMKTMYSLQEDTSPAIVVRIPKPFVKGEEQEEGQRPTRDRDTVIHKTNNNNPLKVDSINIRDDQTTVVLEEEEEEEPAHLESTPVPPKNEQEQKHTPIHVPTNAPSAQQQQQQQSNNNKRTVFFILTGAVRSLSKTHAAILYHLVLPLCPPTSCVSHLVAHFSYSDNRPDTTSGDSTGRAITMNTTEIQYIQSNLDKWFCSSSAGPPHSFHHCHFVQPAYHIGSLEEQQAMDHYENRLLLESSHTNSSTSENTTTAIHHHQVNRIRSLRYADPRRYSMWFSRFYAWNYMESHFLTTTALNDTTHHDEYMFFRPDLLWYLPFMNHDFIQANTLSTTTDPPVVRDVWVHDCYYSATPDTFAYLPNALVAREYFSIEALVQMGVACLGGPDFNATLAKKRLIDRDIFVPGRDVDIDEKKTIPSEPSMISMIVPWCENSYEGWSEQILLKKIFTARLQHRWVPAGTNIVRAHGPDCQPVQPSFLVGWAKHHASPLPILVCLMVQAQFNSKDDAKGALDLIQAVQPFHIKRKRENVTTCLTLRFLNGKTDEQPCTEHPIDMRQVFSSYSDTSHLHVLYEEGKKVELNYSWDVLNQDNTWIKEYLSLYTNKTLQRTQ